MHVMADLTVDVSEKKIMQSQMEKMIPKVLLRLDNQTMTHDLHYSYNNYVRIQLMVL